MLESIEQKMFRWLGGSENYNSEGDGSDEDFGVHISYQDLYLGTVFLTAIYAAGLFTSKLLKMPSLVGEIFAGILLGPNLANIVPIPEAFVMLGEIGYVSCVVICSESGCDIVEMSYLSPGEVEDDVSFFV